MATRANPVVPFNEGEKIKKINSPVITIDVVGTLTISSPATSSTRAGKNLKITILAQNPFAIYAEHGRHLRDWNVIIFSKDEILAALATRKWKMFH